MNTSRKTRRTSDCNHQTGHELHFVKGKGLRWIVKTGSVVTLAIVCRAQDYTPLDAALRADMPSPIERLDDVTYQLARARERVHQARKGLERLTAGTTKSFNLPFFSGVPMTTADKSRLEEELAAAEAELARATNEAQKQPAKRPFQRKILSGTYSYETRDPRVPSLFDLEQHRYEIVTEFAEGVRKEGQSVWRLSPGVALIDGSARHPETGRTRAVESVAPSLSLSLVPRGLLNPKDGLKEWSGSVFGSYSFQTTKEYVPAGPRTELDADVLFVNPSLSHSRPLTPRENKDDNVILRLNAGWSHRQTKEKPDGAAPAESRVQQVSIGARVSAPLTAKVTWDNALSWDIPTREWPVVGRQRTADATVSALTALRMSFFEGARSVSLEYRHTFGDRSFAIDRVSLLGRILL